MKIWLSLSAVGGLLAVFSCFFLAFDPSRGVESATKATDSAPRQQMSKTIHTTSVMTSLETQQEKRLGTLMLCGGGKLPEEIRSRFFSLGGAGNGSLVVIPSASPSSDHSDHAKFLRYWQNYSWKNVKILHILNRHDAQGDDVVLLLKSATAIWIAGGDQNRLASRYQGTSVESEIAGLIGRGGVVGGTSAGSAIASSVMIAGGQHLPTIKYGFNLLPNAIVDQHFSQRNRYSRLSSAVQNFPERVGYGIDEGTAVLFGPEKTEVIGRGNVYIYHSKKSPSVSANADLAPTVVSAGTSIANSELITLTE
jgi:cyanophycinase